MLEIIGSDPLKESISGPFTKGMPCNPFSPPSTGTIKSSGVKKVGTILSEQLLFCRIPLFRMWVHQCVQCCLCVPSTEQKGSAGKLSLAYA